MKKGICGVLLSILVTAFSTAAVMAAEHVSHADGAHGTSGEWKGIATLTEITESGNYYLTGDVNLGGISSIKFDDMDVKLCLNGYKATAAYKYQTDSGMSTANFCTQFILTNSTLEIFDEAGGSIEYIAGTGQSFNSSTMHGIMLTNSELTINGGYIHGNIATIINVGKDSSLTVNGGKIVSTYSPESNSSAGTSEGAVAVYVAENCKAVTINHGLLEGINYAKTTGFWNSPWAAGMDVHGENVTINGGEIKGIVENPDKSSQLRWEVNGTGLLIRNFGKGITLSDAAHITGSHNALALNLGGVTSEEEEVFSPQIVITKPFSDEMRALGVYIINPSEALKTYGFTSGWGAHMDGKEPKQCFYSQSKGYVIQEINGELALVKTDTAPENIVTIGAVDKDTRVFINTPEELENIDDKVKEQAVVLLDGKAYYGLDWLKRVAYYSDAECTQGMLLPVSLDEDRIIYAKVTLDTTVIKDSSFVFNKDVDSLVIEVDMKKYTEDKDTSESSSSSNAGQGSSSSNSGAQDSNSEGKDAAGSSSSSADKGSTSSSSSQKPAAAVGTVWSIKYSGITDDVILTDVKTNYTEGQKSKITTAASRPGYKFAGWYTDATLKAKAKITKKTTGELTLYPKWKPCKYKVEYAVDTKIAAKQSLMLTKLKKLSFVKEKKLAKLMVDAGKIKGWAPRITTSLNGMTVSSLNGVEIVSGLNASEVKIDRSNNTVSYIPNDKLLKNGMTQSDLESFYGSEILWTPKKKGYTGEIRLYPVF